MPSQAEISAHLDLDQAAVSRFVNEAGIDWRAAAMDDIRVAYIRQLRARAAGHRSADGGDLVAERVQMERVQRELLLMQLVEKRQALVNAEQFRGLYAQMVEVFRTEMQRLADRLKADVDTLYGIDADRELVNRHVLAAVGQLTRYEPSSGGADRQDNHSPH